MSEYSTNHTGFGGSDTVLATLRRTPPCGHPISGHRPSLQTNKWNRCSGLAGNCRVGEGIPRGTCTGYTDVLHRFGELLVCTYGT